MEGKNAMTKYVGYIFILLSIMVVLYVAYMNSHYSTVTRTFSPYTLITSSWEIYKDKFMTRDGRVLDKTQGDVTTSEGQSYALLRAVWVDDKDTFDMVWKWTKTNLKHENDSLFGWRWGKQEDNAYGFMPGGGENAASDADSDIALALILASRRWEQKEYEVEAKNILKDIWERETTTAFNSRYLIAGEWANRED
jgi:endoglucanase